MSSRARPAYGGDEGEAIFANGDCFGVSPLTMTGLGRLIPIYFCNNFFTKYQKSFSEFLKQSVSQKVKGRKDESRTK